MSQETWELSNEYEVVFDKNKHCITGCPMYTRELITHKKSSLVRVSAVLPNFNGQNKVTPARVNFI